MSPRDVESKLGLNFGAPPGFKRLKLVISYCGTPWRGWQSLSGGNTVQDELNAAVRKATRAETVVHGSGRTDAGVHALGQVGHMDVPETLRMSPAAWAKALNACLPLSIRVLTVEEPDPKFHSRYDAVGKTYRYRIWRPALLSPFEADRAWHVHGELDMAALQLCMDRLVGTHNFVRLSANRGDMPETVRRTLHERTTRTIHRTEIRETESDLWLEFEGDGFLYRMVRLIVGSLMMVARGRASTDWFHQLLTHDDAPQTNQTAPAGGLYLAKVIY